MKVSLSWLKELVDIKLSPRELADKLSLISIGVKALTGDYLELDLTYNRGDLLSLRGVAQEMAAITGSKFKPADLDLPKSDRETPVRVENTKLAPIYCIAKIENLKVKGSNDTWVKKLNDSGIRAINNVADVTNLIMLEYDQPMHAFDARGVKDETLIVRLAKQGERITTLDGKTRDLETADLLITDSLNALGIAGVMGGKDSEVNESTTAILLEAAIFDPINIRKTAQRLGLHSEASKRFQHGLTKTNLLAALAAAIKMYEGLGGKLTALTLKGNLEDKPKVVELDYKKVGSLIGVEITDEEIEEALTKLGFKVEQGRITVPFWRLDIEIEEDLIEEVARMYGYDKIPPQKLRGELPEKLDESLQDLVYNLKVILKNAGLTEVQTYSFFSSKILVTCHLSLVTLLKIANPISSETGYLRNMLWPNLIEVVAKNIKQGYKDIAIFEIGKVYNPEKYHLAIALMNGSDNPLAELANIFRHVQLTHAGHVQLGKRDLFHPNRFTENMAEVHPRILNKLGIEKRVAIMEVEFS